MSTPTLTPTQSLILTTAIQSYAGQLAWFPENLKGGARLRVMDALQKRGLITADLEAPDLNSWKVTVAGYEALGQTPPEALTGSPTGEELETAPAEAPAETRPRRTREDSKQAAIIALLKRPEGATIPQLVEATGWQAHTVRGAFAGALKKKLGLTITSTKAAGEDRVYRIA